MKRLKAHIVKLIAIVISIMYILMPIHHEVKITLHSMSHYLEMPDFVLSHNHNENLNYNLKVSAISDHEHKIIELLDYFIADNTSENDSNKPSIIDTVIDKHFHSSKYNKHNLVSVMLPFVNYQYKEEIKDGFQTKIKIPPKSIKTQL